MSKPETPLAKDLMELGFQRMTANKFCCRINDIAVIVCIERLGLVYVWFAIIPLFMPCKGHIYFTYGNRFSSMFVDCHSLVKDATAEEFRSLYESVVMHVEDDLLPFARSLSTADALCSFAEAGTRMVGRWSRYMGTPSLERKRLLMYSCLSAGKYQEAKKATRKYIRSLEKTKYLSKDLIGRKKAEGEKIIDLIEKQQFRAITEILDQNIAENLEMLKLSGTTYNRDWRYNE